MQAVQFPFITYKTEMQEKNPKADQGLITRGKGRQQMNTLEGRDGGKD